MAEDNGAQGHDENVAFARESRANPGDFKEQLFNTWMKKGRGSIRRKYIKLCLNKKIH